MSARAVKAELTYEDQQVNPPVGGSLVLAQAVRLQLSNLAARNCRTAGVQGASKLLVMINYLERGNPVPSPSGQVNREANCWRSGV